jgi:hypothetical protein
MITPHLLKEQSYGFGHNATINIGAQFNILTGQLVVIFTIKKSPDLKSDDFSLSFIQARYNHRIILKQVIPRKTPSSLNGLHRVFFEQG